MKRIRAQKPGTTVVQKLNQGFSRLYECREGIKRRGSFLGTLAPALTKEVDKQKGTKLKKVDYS